MTFDYHLKLKKSVTTKRISLENSGEFQEKATNFEWGYIKVIANNSLCSYYITIV